MPPADYSNLLVLAPEKPLDELCKAGPADPAICPTVYIAARFAPQRITRMGRVPQGSKLAGCIEAQRLCGVALTVKRPSRQSFCWLIQAASGDTRKGAQFHLRHLFETDLQ